MATRNVSQRPARSTSNALGAPARLDVTLHATYQVEQLLLAMRHAAEENAEGLPHLVLGMLPRLEQLNAMMMSASGDALQSVQHLILEGQLWRPRP
ncbi:hypothetical protein SAMN05216567_101736 [Variovorax sp. OK605]|jgi:hypothetical protein|uniref:hypothetical protein n=1 Tax=unclassified Variovorax TaxID=663243 RepID=UPI0008B39DB6|nr:MULTISPECIES: hypothetical protein [unclassified Variovorax]SEK07201.1 hypothetical protein SAMN05518853_107283 [Variovorax sp. OK202]SFD49561.1 hypothetical protein SAMN05444746_107283 [Variovorax sp. OK212]SFO61741.1 hypothetical protein SAMN05216567_101736 [Variovorax sp. OK605]